MQRLTIGAQSIAALCLAGSSNPDIPWGTMTKFTDAKIQEMANALVNISYHLRTDPSDAFNYVDILRRVLEEVDELGAEYAKNMSR